MAPLENIQSIDEEEDLPLTGEQVPTKDGLPTLHLPGSPVSSIIVKENSLNRLTISQPIPATKTVSGRQLSELEPQKSTPSKENVLEKVHSTIEAPESRCISQTPPYAAGRPWSTGNVQTVNLPKYILSPLRRLHSEVAKANRRYQQAQDGGKVIPPMKKPPVRDLVSQLTQHFGVIASTDSVDEAWNSYVFLVDLIAGTPIVYRHVQHIPFVHLHRMARLLARNRPQTRRQFLRLLAVLTYLNYWGGRVKQHEWNSLVTHAGSGWRKTKLEDFGNAMKVFNDMRAGRLPGSSRLRPPDREFLEGPAVEPDIYTYTSLLAIAARATDSKNLHNISSMLTKAGLPPNRITHLSLMRHFTLKADLGGIRATLLKMRQQGLELGLDGLNACLWAYGRNGRLDIVMMIYRALRHNVLPETYTGQKDINEAIGRLGEEYIFVEPELQPNEITLTTVIQVMAYHGHFTSTLNIFMDMLSSNNLEKGAPLQKNSTGVYEPTSYKPSLAVFRAIFLGFSRHARHVQHDSDWNMDNLSQIFDLFLELPSDSNLTHNTIYLIMLAFDKASGRDVKMLRNVWVRMDRRFGMAFHKPHSASRLARLQRLLFPDDETTKER